MSNIKEHVQVLRESQTILPGNEQDFPFPPHAESHEEGGYDEVDVAKLIGTLSHLNLSDIGVKTHAEIDTHIGIAEAFFADPSTPGDFTLEGGGAIRSTAGGDIFLVPDIGGFSRVGTGIPLLSLSEQDFFISGIAEVGGLAQVGSLNVLGATTLGDLTLTGNSVIDPNLFFVFWDLTGISAAGFYGFKNVTQGLHMFAERNNVILTSVPRYNTDHGRGVDLTPTFYIFSGQNPVTLPNRCVKMTHTGTAGVIESLFGTLNLGGVNNINLAGAAYTASPITNLGFVTIPVAGVNRRFMVG